jgi:cell division protein ZapE
VILSGVPKLSPGDADSARRFTWLVDVFYDVRVKLAVAAEAQPDELFPEGDQSAEFARTASRLTEMQSAEYVQAERRRESGGSGKVQGLPA